MYVRKCCSVFANAGVCVHKVCAYTRAHKQFSAISCIFCFSCSPFCAACALICFCARKSVGKRSGFSRAEDMNSVLQLPCLRVADFLAYSFCLSFFLCFQWNSFEYFFFLFFCLHFAGNYVLYWLTSLANSWLADNYVSPAMNSNSPKWKLTFTCYPINYASWACKK